MNSEVLAIGTELLLGEIVDTNGAWLGQELALAGVDVHHQVKVGDNLGRIVDALRHALTRRAMVGTLALAAAVPLAAPAAVAQLYFGGAGPDAFGHMGNDSLFNLRDISTTGQLLNLDDDQSVNRLLGFDFNYFGTTFNSVNVSSNGFLSFTSTSNPFLSSTLPGSGVNNMIAGAWTETPGQMPDGAVIIGGSARRSKTNV